MLHPELWPKQIIISKKEKKIKTQQVSVIFLLAKIFEK